MTMVVAVMLTLGVSLAMALTIASRLLVICGPRELLVIAGRSAAPGLRYSVLRGGRMLRVPGLQRVFRLPLGVFEASFSIRTCDQHHVPVTLSGVVSLRIGEDDASIARAAPVKRGGACATRSGRRQPVATTTGGRRPSHRARGNHSPRRF